MADPAGIVALLVVVAFVVVVVALLRHAPKVNAKRILGGGEKLFGPGGFRTEPRGSGPQTVVFGPHRDEELCLFDMARRPGAPDESTWAYTVLARECATGPDLLVRPRTAFNRIQRSVGESRGLREVPTGRPDLDEALVVCAVDEDAARTALAADAALRGLEALRTLPRFAALQSNPASRQIDFCPMPGLTTWTRIVLWGDVASHSREDLERAVAALDLVHEALR